jgi:hypothetical protein
MTESRDPSTEGEILKASGPGPEQVQVGMDVTSIDGERIGKVKEVRGEEILIDRPLARDLWVPFSSVMATEDYSSNYRGGLTEPIAVVLNVSAAHIDRQGWREA